MTTVRVAWLVGVALLVLVLNVGASVLYMVVYGHIVKPGLPPEHYHDHIKVAAPYCSIVAGMPLMFAAGYWVAGWWDAQGGVKAAFVMWLAYLLIDGGVLLAAGMNRNIAGLFAVSFLTKLAAAYLGAQLALRGSGPGAALGAD